MHNEMRAIATEHRVLFAEYVKYDVARYALVPLLSQPLKSVRMTLGCSGLDDKLDSGLAVDDFDSTAVRARLLVDNTAAVTHRTQLGVRLR